MMKMVRILIPKSRLWIIIASLGVEKSQNLFFQFLKKFWEFFLNSRFAIFDSIIIWCTYNQQIKIQKFRGSGCLPLEIVVEI